jgi:hypothetical protein
MRSTDEHPGSHVKIKSRHVLLCRARRRHRHQHTGTGCCTTGHTLHLHSHCAQSAATAVSSQRRRGVASHQHVARVSCTSAAGCTQCLFAGVACESHTAMQVGASSPSSRSLQYRLRTCKPFSGGSSHYQLWDQSCAIIACYDSEEAAATQERSCTCVMKGRYWLV